MGLTEKSPDVADAVDFMGQSREDTQLSYPKIKMKRPKKPSPQRGLKPVRNTVVYS